MKIGDNVKVLPCSEDDNANADYKEKTGRIIHLTTNFVVGETLVTVEFEDGQRDGFWADELEVI